MSERAGPPGDAGNAPLEFLVLAVVLLIPVAYLVLTLGRLQAAVFASESAARQSARAFVLADDAGAGERAAVLSVGLALSDQGFEDDPAAALRLVCSDQPCLTPGAEVSATVRVEVPLPFVPGFIRDAVPLSVPVEAQHAAVVDQYRSTR